MILNAMTIFNGDHVHSTYPPVMTNIAMEYGHRNRAVSPMNSMADLSTAMLNSQRVQQLSKLIGYIVLLYRVQIVDYCCT